MIEEVNKKVILIIPDQIVVYQLWYAELKILIQHPLL
jgi:hypothetical protein